MLVRHILILCWLCLFSANLVACTKRAASVQPDSATTTATTQAQASTGIPAANAMSNGPSTPSIATTDLRVRLSPLAYAVTQEGGTEPAFQNAYWDEHRPGLFVDVIDGTPLFSSADKFESGTGWPSFTSPIRASAVKTRTDNSQGMDRVEVVSASSGAHLGHRFDDGPAPAHLRFCMNSAALRFVPLDALEGEGYGAIRQLVQASSVPRTEAIACAANATSDAATHESAPGASGCRATTEVALLAGGCFWGVEELLRGVPGVLETTAGYTGGYTDHPTYDDVHTGRTGHAEAVRIVFDPQRVTFRSLLDDWFFRIHDPTTANRQGNDRGSQYRSAIFTTSEDQAVEARAAKVRAERSGRWKDPIVTEIVPARAFTAAEPEHQRYLERNPSGYTCHFRRD